MQIKRSHFKVAGGLFWAESWLFFRISTLFLPFIYIKIDRQTKLEDNRTQNGLQKYFEPISPKIMKKIVGGLNQKYSSIRISGI